MNVTIGVDPGITGAFAVLEADSKQLLDVMDMPLLSEGKKQRIHGYELAKLLGRWNKGDYQVTMVYLEKVHAMPKQGVTSMFSMGRSFGAVETAISMLAMPITYITPQVWKRRARLIGQDKDVARTRALELYPEAPLTRKRDHNRADAILIARYGDRR